VPHFLPSNLFCSHYRVGQETEAAAAVAWEEPQRMMPTFRVRNKKINDFFKFCFSAKVVNRGTIPTVEGRVPVQLNGYKMIIGQAAVFQFEIQFTGMCSFQPEGQEAEKILQDLARGPINE
jgi:hypothetical protein